MREQGRRQAEDRRRSRQQLTQNITTLPMSFSSLSFTFSPSIV